MTNSTDGTVTRIDPASGRGEKTFPAIVGRVGHRGRIRIASGSSRPRRASRRCPRPALRPDRSTRSASGSIRAAVAARRRRGLGRESRRRHGLEDRAAHRHRHRNVIRCRARSRRASQQGPRTSGSRTRGTELCPASIRRAVTVVESTPLENPPRDVALAPRGSVRRRRLERSRAPRAEASRSSPASWTPSTRRWRTATRAGRS